MEKLDLLAQWMARQIIRFRWWVSIGCIMIFFLCAQGGKNIYFKNDYQYFFSKKNPQLQEFNKIQNIYTKNDNILFVMAPKSGIVFNESFLKSVELLTHEAWQIPYSIRVDSITNFQHTRAVNDDLFVQDLVDTAHNYSEEDLNQIKKIAVNEPLLNNRLITSKAHVTGVNVTLEMPPNAVNEVPEAMHKARALKAMIEEKYPDVQIYLSGMVPLSNAFFEASMHDMKTLVPMMYLGIMITIFIMLRSFLSTVITVVVIFMSVLSAMGVAGWLHIPLTPPSSTAPTMIMTLAVADCIHILISALKNMRHGFTKNEALIESLRVNTQPVFLTSLTTAIGFLSMNFSDAPPFQDLGNITAIGVGFAYFYAVILLPAFVAIFPIKTKIKNETSHHIYDRFSDWLIAHNRKVLWVGLGVVIFLQIMVFKNDLNDEFVKYFGPRIQFRTDTTFMMENLTGVYQIEFSLDSGESYGISEPQYLKTLDAFKQWWYTHQDVMHVSSFSDIMKRLNKNMHGDDETFYQIPSSRELASQYLLLYEMSLPYGLDLNNQINVDKSSTRFVITLDNISSKEIRHYVQLGEEWLKDHAAISLQSHGVGTSVMFSNISSRNIKSMLIGTIFAFFLISFCLIFALKSWKYGLISLIPNLVPAVSAFGIWGMLVGQVNVALSVVTAMSLGIVVDDTVHFLSKFIRAKREKNFNNVQAVHYAFNTVGTALIVTSMILIVGFSILSFSDFAMNGRMGLLTAITIFIALIADFFLLPALLIFMNQKFKSKESIERSIV